MSEESSDGEYGLSTLQYFARSCSRLRVLSALCESPADPSTLQAELDIPRTTLRRNLNGLEERGWLVMDANTYRAVLPARLAETVVGETIQALDTAARLTEFFETLPPQTRQTAFDDLDVADILSCIDEVQVVLPTKATPYAPAAHLEDRISNATSIRGFAPTGRPFAGSHLEEFLRTGGRGELIVPADDGQLLLSEFDEVLSESERGDGFRILVVEELPPYGLLLFDEGVLLVGFDEYFRPHALVYVPCHCGNVQAWAEASYGHVREAVGPNDGLDSSDLLQKGLEDGDDAEDDCP